MRVSWMTASAIAWMVVFGTVGCGPGNQRRAVDHLTRGQFLLDQGQLEAALAELEKAIRLNPELASAYANIGDVYRKSGDHEKARRAYEVACRIAPYEFRPHYNLGVTYQLLASAAKAFDESQRYLRKAVHAYLRAVVLKPRDFDTNLNLSACYFQLGKYDMAEQYCQVAVYIDPDSAQAYSNLGIIYDSQNRLWEAVKAYKMSLEIEVHQPELLLNLGSTYLRMGPRGRVRSALAAFKLAAVQAPNNSAAWEYVGLCRYRLREYDKALEAYEKAVSLDPESPSIQRALGVSCMTLFLLNPKSEDYHSRALSAWSRSLSLEPDQEDLLHLVRKYTPAVTGPEL